MKVTPIKTKIIRPFSDAISDILAGAFRRIPENSIVAITSKIISLCEGAVEKPGLRSKEELIEQEADLFLPKSGNKYDVYLTIKNNTLIPNAGVDESNVRGAYVLWPKDPQASAIRCWQFLKTHFHVRHVGVLITDSTDTPLKWGVSGICVAHCGFVSPSDKIGQTDLFGRKLKMTKINVADALAAAAVLCMGEADEQTPLALIEELPFVRFQKEPPTAAEQRAQHISLQDDLFGQLLCSASWQSRKTS